MDELQIIEKEHQKEALDILATTPLVDGHNDWPHLIRGFYDNTIQNSHFEPDAPLVGHVDIKRLRKGKAGGIFWSAYIDWFVTVVVRSSALANEAPLGESSPSTESDFSDENHFEIIRDTLQQIDLIHRLVEKYDDVLEIALSSEEVLQSFRRGKVACLLGVEGLHQIGNSASVLRMYHRLGVRYVTLTHNKNNRYADSAMSKKVVHEGLSSAGHDIVREMNRIGMMIDLSHASDLAARAVLGMSTAPVLFTHSSAQEQISPTLQEYQWLTEFRFGICAKPRNAPDATLFKLKENNGVIMVSFIPELTHSTAVQASVQHVVDHILYIASKIGFDHVGIGSDFDGMANPVIGLEDVSKFPALVAAMLARGIDRYDIQKIIGLNVIRVMQQVEQIARGSRGVVPVLEDKVKQLWSDDIRGVVREMYSLTS